MEICKKQSYKKFSPKKLLKFAKVVKPVAKLIWRKPRTNAVTPSACNYVVESAQNDANDVLRLQWRFTDEAADNSRNEELEERLLRGAGPRATLDARGAVRGPPNADADLDSCRGCATGRQTAECQAPVLRSCA